MPRPCTSTAICRCNSTSNKPSFKKVDLNGAKIAGNVSMIGASLRRRADLPACCRSRAIYSWDHCFEHKASFKEVFLPGAVIRGQLNMSGASFDRCAKRCLLAGRWRFDHDRRSIAPIRSTCPIRMLVAILICAAPVWATSTCPVHRLSARYNSVARMNPRIGRQATENPAP